MTENGAKTTEIQKAPVSYSKRFTDMIVREFGSQVGKMALTPMQQRLAQHMFIGIDAGLKKLEATRIKKGQKDKLPIIWSNINMDKLAIDAVHRVELGLDALIQNHIHPIPYMNSKTGKYDLDLQIGYVGKDYYKRKMALNEPKDIKYHLVRKNENFTPLWKDAEREVESYRLMPPENPFDPGEIIGGFGYIVYDDPTLNKLVLVTEANFAKSKKAAKTNDFWGPHPDEMKMVVLVRRTTDALKVDPEKVNASYLQVELDEAENQVKKEQEENANQDFIDIEDDEQGHEEGEIVDAEFEESEIKDDKQGRITSNNENPRTPGF